MNLERNHQKENIFLLQKLNASQAEEVALRGMLDDAYGRIEELEAQIEEGNKEVAK